MGDFKETNEIERLINLISREAETFGSVTLKLDDANSVVRYLKLMKRVAMIFDEPISEGIGIKKNELPKKINIKFINGVANIELDDGAYVPISNLTF